MSLRIHFFVQFIHEQGTYFRFHNLARALAGLGQEVHVFGCDHDTRAQARDEVRDGIPYSIVPSSKGTSLVGPFAHPLNAAKRWWKTYPPCDIAHLFQPFPNAALAWLRAPATRRFYDWDDLWVGGLIGENVTTFHERFTKTVTGFFEKRLPARADHVTTCSQYLNALATRRGANHVSLVYNGYWPYQPKSKEAARVSLGLQPGALYAGFMGRTCNELSWCIEALAANLTRWPNLRLALCGFPAFLLDDIAPEVRARIDYLGQLTPLAARDFAAALDLGLLPLEDSAFNQSRFPIKFTEYMAAGTPALASEVGECHFLAKELPWVLKAGVSKPEWIDHFGNALALIRDHSLPAVKLESVRQTLSWDAIGLHLLSSYRAALAPVSPVVHLQPQSSESTVVDA